MIAADTGRPLVQHVVDQCRKAKRVRNVIVATDGDGHRVVRVDFMDQIDETANSIVSKQAGTPAGEPHLAPRVP